MKAQKCVHGKSLCTKCRERQNARIPKSVNPIMTRALVSGRNKKRAKRLVAEAISSAADEIRNWVSSNSGFAMVDVAQAENDLQERYDADIDNGFGKVVAAAVDDERDSDAYKRLKRVVHSDLWDRVRQLRRTRRRRQELEREQVAPDEASRQADLEVSADEVLDKAVVEHHLREALEKLPIDLQHVIRMRYIAGVTVSKIAETDGVSEATVRRRLAEGRDVLWNALAGILKDLS